MHFSSDAWVKNVANLLCQLFALIGFLCSLSFLSNLTKWSQFGCEDGSVCQKWHILRVTALAGLSYQTV